MSAIATSTAPFRFPVRVYYEDTDAAGVVYYANYLRYLERARTEWLHSLGHPVTELASRDGVVFVVRRVVADFHSPARLLDSLDVSVALKVRRHVSLEIDQEILRDGNVLVRAQVTLACVDSAMKPTRIPDALRSLAPSRHSQIPA